MEIISWKPMALAIVDFKMQYEQPLQVEDNNLNFKHFENPKHVMWNGGSISPSRWNVIQKVQMIFLQLNLES